MLNSSEWLFAYEVLINRWHNRYARIALPENSALYQLMIDNSVSFLDESQLDSIELPAVFRRHAPEPSPEEPDEGLDSDDFLAMDEVESNSPAIEDDAVDSMAHS